MAFTLLKVGDYVFPLRFIQIESYQTAPNQRQDVDSGVNNANGVLDRNTLPHTRTKVEFNTTYMYLKDVRELMRNIKSRYTDYTKRELTFSYYDIENDKFVEDATGYIQSSLSFTFYNVNEKNKDLSIVAPIRFAIIEN